MRGFRQLQQVDRSYDEQGYIYFTSRLYPYLPQEDRDGIDGLCKDIAGDSWRALLDFVRGEKTREQISIAACVSVSTLNNWRAEYYRRFLE